MRILRWMALMTTMLASAASAMDLAVLSFNIRWANPIDGKNAWSNRRDFAAEVIAKNGVDIAGLQEALVGQLADLKRSLPEYESIGVGRDDGKEAGEFSAILYNARKFDVEKNGTFWLSETPETLGSMSWDTACTRVATWGVFRSKENGMRIFVLNTHLDHRSAQAREEAAKLIAGKIRELAGNLPVVVTGDFNAVRDSAPLQTLASSDLLHHTRELANFPVKSTFNSFDDLTEGKEIDHILVSPTIEVVKFAVLEEKRGGIFVSDHWPVMARLRVP